MQGQRRARLHVGRAAAMDQVALGARRQVSGDRHGIEVASEDEPLLSVVAGAADHHVADPLHRQVRQTPQRRLDLPGQPRLVAGHRLDIDQGTGQLDRIGQDLRTQHAPTLTADAQVPDAWYPAGKLGFGTPAVEARAGVPLPAAEVFDSPVAEAGPIPGLRTVAVLTLIGSLTDPPKDTYDAYLRLHLLSHRLIRPHQANLDGIFGVLPNVAWTSAGPCLPDRVDELRWALRARGERLAVYGVDKFPRMTDYVVPSGVRVADADRVRLGAHLAAGTTVMQEGFV